MMNAKEIIEAGRRVFVDNISVSQDMMRAAGLPECYHGKREYRKLSSIVSQFERRMANRETDPRNISVKFDDSRNITRATAERLAAIENYRKQVEQNEQNEVGIVYDVNEDKQYNAMVTFAKACPVVAELIREELE